MCVRALTIGALLVTGAIEADAANRTVCASGCQYTSLQAAIDAALPGDTILLRAGETFTGSFVLRNKNTTSTQFITIRSDAADSRFPAAGGRLIPEGRPGANTQRSSLARLVGPGGTGKSTPVVRTTAGAHHYRLQFLEIDGVANVGYETLVALGASSGQTSLSDVPHSLVIDRVWLRGHPVKGMKRGIYLNSGATDILGCYFDDFFSFSDSQAISGTNGPGPYRIVNNYLEAAGENVMFGGDDPHITNLVPSDIQIRGNYMTKDLRWRQAILATPSRPSATASTASGSLSAGTHYFKVSAVISSGGGYGYSAGSAEASVTVSAGRSVSLSWPAVAGADKYYIYRGTSSNGQSRYLETVGAETSFTYTGASERSGTPRSSGTRWTVKNLLELKNAQRVSIDANVFEYNWDGFQQGYSILFTPRNQSGGAPWSVVRDVTFTNNIVRNVGAVFQILGRDYTHSSQQTRNVTIRNNVFERIDNAYGNTGRFVSITEGPANLVIDHNTVDHEGTVVEVMNGAVSGFVFTNNLSRHNTYGIKGQNLSSGNPTLSAFFPSAVFRANVLAGGPASSYPSGNFFPSEAQFLTQFVAAATGDWRLASASVYNNAGTDGTDIGADIPALQAAQAAAGDGPGDPPPPPPGDGGGGGGGGGGGSLPSGWTSRDVGAVGQPGSASGSGSSLTVNGAGADVWDRADAFHFVYQSLAGDGTITAQVSSITGAEAWTKVGVMIRSSTAANAAHAFMIVSTGKGLAFQRRSSDGGLSAHTSGGSGTAPRWVRLTRRGSVVTAYASTNGTSWTTVGSATITLPATALVGVAVSSHDTTRLATGTFENVAVQADGGSVAWQSRDVGPVGLTGSTAGSGSSLTVRGAGADVWGRADAFRFAYQPLDGDGTVTARVVSISGTEGWTKVGVMMRASTAADAAHAFMIVSRSKGLAFQRRPSAGSLSAHTSGGSGTAPRWVRLTRRDDVVTAAVSSGGTSWTTVGSATIDLPETALVGVAVSSHDTTRLATGSFESVSVEDSGS